MDSRVPFDKFKYVALYSRVSQNRLFPYALPYIMTVCYCKNEEKTTLGFHPKRLYINPPKPINIDWLQEVLYDRNQFISRIYWCAKCETLLFEIKTAAFTACVRKKETFSTASNFSHYLMP
jgi:hypothetical protein